MTLYPAFFKNKEKPCWDLAVCLVSCKAAMSKGDVKTSCCEEKLLILAVTSDHAEDTLEISGQSSRFVWSSGEQCESLLRTGEGE